MNATGTTVSGSANVEEQARIVSGLLKEYAAKLADLIWDCLELPDVPHTQKPARIAWLLDQGELLCKPLSNIISRGSGLLEHSALSPLIQDELMWRMREIEIHLHHTLLRTHELHQGLADMSRTMPEEAAKLRLAAGLSGMKGGPLRPNE
jgi:hypothetical protein